jgi:hypothetical protein
MGSTELCLLVSLRPDSAKAKISLLPWSHYCAEQRRLQENPTLAISPPKRIRRLLIQIYAKVHIFGGNLQSLTVSYNRSFTPTICP